MEKYLAVEMFCRSVEKHNLRYTVYTGDGNTSSFGQVKDALYNKFQHDYPVKKKDCIGHVQKRMGSASSIYKSKCRGGKLPDGKTAGGRGRLTDAVVNKIQNYYGVAIRSNIGKLKGTQNAIWAIYFHMIMGPSNDTLNEKHHYCPVTLDSWCKHQVDQINDARIYNQQNCLPPVFRSEMHYVFKQLSADSLLQDCQRGLTQNQNKSLNNGLGSLSKGCALRYSQVPNFCLRGCYCL